VHGAIKQNQKSQDSAPSAEQTRL